MSNRTLRNPTPSRKARFRAALALAHTTMREWAEQQGVTTGHLHQVLSGDRESVTLTTAVDAFIEQHLPLSAA
jgi:hypothetical protein